jgi:hypothetical protein
MAVNALTTWVARPAAPALCESARRPLFDPTHGQKGALPDLSRREPGYERHRRSDLSGSRRRVTKNPSSNPEIYV